MGFFGMTECIIFDSAVFTCRAGHQPAAPTQGKIFFYFIMENVRHIVKITINSCRGMMFDLQLLITIL